MTVLDALGTPITLPATGDATTPVVGDVWVISTDDSDRGVVLVAAVRPSHVLAWAMTTPSASASAPAFQIEVPAVGTLVAWPESEFGLSMAALDRRLGHVVGDRTMREIRWSLTGGVPSSSVLTCPKQDTPESLDALDMVCDQAWAFSEWSWPSGDVECGVFDQEALQKAQVTARALHAVLPGPAAHASALASARKVPSAEETLKVLALFPAGTRSEDVLSSVSGDEAEALGHPEFKSRVRALVRNRALDERRIRSVIWEEASLRAARQATHLDKTDAARARVDYALQVLLDEDA